VIDSLTRSASNSAIRSNSWSTGSLLHYLQVVRLIDSQSSNALSLFACHCQRRRSLCCRRLLQDVCWYASGFGFRSAATRLVICLVVKLASRLVYGLALAFIDTPVPSLPVMCRFASSMLMPLLRPYQSISLSWFRHRRPPTPSEKILIRQLTPAIDAAAVSLRPSRLNRRTRYIRTLSNTIRP